MRFWPSARASGSRPPAAARSGAATTRAAAGLLERALELTRPAHLDVVLELDLAQALFLDSPKAAAVADAAAERARAAGDEAGEALARGGAAYHRSFLWPIRPSTSSSRSLRAALPLLEQAEDHAGLVHVWTALLRRRELALPLRGLCARVGAGAPPRPAGRPAQVGSLPPRQRAHLGAAAGGRGAPYARRAPARESAPLAAAGASLAADHARPLRRGSADRDRGRPTLARAHRRRLGRFRLCFIATTVGDHESAAVQLRRFCDLVEARGQRYFLSTYAPMLGPLALRARPLRRGRAARPARPRARRDRAGRAHADALAAGTGARPCEPRPARGGRGSRPRGRRDHGANRTR